MFTIRKLSVVAAIAAGSGCVARAGAYVETPEVEVFVPEPPTLVWIGPSIWVVQDIDVPVYYVDNYYWSWRGGVWYRSQYWDDGWVHIETHAVPTMIVHKRHEAYVRYHAPAHAKVWHAPPEHARHPRGAYEPANYRPPGTEEAARRPQPLPAPQAGEEASSCPRALRAAEAAWKGYPWARRLSTAQAAEEVPAGSTAQTVQGAQATSEHAEARWPWLSHSARLRESLHPVTVRDRARYTRCSLSRTEVLPCPTPIS